MIQSLYIFFHAEMPSQHQQLLIAMHYATDRPEVPKVVSVVEVIDCEL